LNTVQHVSYPDFEHAWIVSIIEKVIILEIYGDIDMVFIDINLYVTKRAKAIRVGKLM